MSKKPTILNIRRHIKAMHPTDVLSSTTLVLQVKQVEMEAIYLSSAFFYCIEGMFLY